MMKKILLAMIVVCVAVTANAGMTIVILDEETGAWREYPDSEFTITPSTYIEIGLKVDFAAPTGAYALGLLDGAGSLGDDVQILAEGAVTAALTDDALQAESLGLQNPFVSIDLTSAFEGVLLRGTFHCDGAGDVTLAEVNSNGVVIDTQVIHQVIPEPATMALLGLGALLLRRRK